MTARWVALGLSVLLATAANGQPVAKDEPTEKPATEKPAIEKLAAEGFAAESAAEKPVKPASKKAEKKVDKKAEKKAEKPKPAAGEPKTTTVDKLPGALKTVHVCAMPKATVEIDSEAYARAVVFFISCTAARGALTPHAVYVARDVKGSGAKLVEGLAPDGSASKLEMLYSVTPAREAFTKEGDQQPHAHVKADTPWFVGAWAPDDRPGVCAVSATWRLQGDKAELHLWEEAKECPKGELPKYEAKVDKKPPPLVGR